MRFISDDFKKYLQNNINTLDVIESPYAVKSIIANIKAMHTKIFERDQFVVAFTSTVTLDDVNIQNVYFTGPVIELSLSALNGSNIMADNISNPDGSYNPFISCSIDSFINIDNLDYSQSETSMFLLSNVTGFTHDVYTVSSSSLSNMIEADDWHGLIISDLNIADVSSETESVLLIKDNTNIMLEDIVISDIHQLVIQIQNSVVSKASSLNLTNCRQGIKIFYQSNIMINSSIFESIGSSDVISGGAIQSSDSNTIINNSSFSKCHAKQGGWLALNCSLSSICRYEISNSKFSDNVADIKGGAIYYDLYRPVLFGDLFFNNTAKYGKNIASYSIKIILKGLDTDQIILQEVVSGQIYTPSLEFQLIDHDGQVILTDSTSTILINPFNNTTSIDGTNVVLVNQDVANFDEFIFTSKPGSRNINFEVTSKAISRDIVNFQYNGALG